MFSLFCCAHIKHPNRHRPNQLFLLSCGVHTTEFEDSAGHTGPARARKTNLSVLASETMWYQPIFIELQEFNVFWILLCALKNAGRNRRKCECGVVKGAGQSGVQSEHTGTTYFRRLVQNDSCCEHEQVRLVLQSASKCTATTARGTRSSDVDGGFSCFW